MLPMTMMVEMNKMTKVIVQNVVALTARIMHLLMMLETIPSTPHLGLKRIHRMTLQTKSLCHPFSPTLTYSTRIALKEVVI